ncbi:MAG: hypothetical protein KC662_00285 [Candidatus Magasanikbacteria bacterium]|nr:hypothetical protein [Candidatus Magasanikbacteria bacterium]
MAWARVSGPGDSDAVCDAIAAAIAEEYLRRDSGALLDIHVTGGHGALFVTGNVSSTADFDVSSIIRRELGKIDPTLQAEPFITLEPMPEPRAFGGAEPWTAMSAASSASELLLPDTQGFAIACVRALEQKRQQDPDWYWLTSDYAIAVTDEKDKRRVQANVIHSDGVTPDEVRVRFAALLSNISSQKVLDVEVLCQQGVHSLMRRVGASRNHRAYSYARMPNVLQGCGRELSHPTNLGQWYARAIARELLKSQQLESVAIELDWYPHESKPRAVRAIDQAGRDLATLVDLDRCDLARPPTGWDDPSLLLKSEQFTYTVDEVLPWER